MLLLMSIAIGNNMSVNSKTNASASDEQSNINKDNDTSVKIYPSVVLAKRPACDAQMQTFTILFLL